MEEERGTDDGCNWRGCRRWGWDAVLRVRSILGVSEPFGPMALIGISVEEGEFRKKVSVIGECIVARKAPRRSLNEDITARDWDLGRQGEARDVLMGKREKVPR
jgi:hypothetical protein